MKRTAVAGVFALAALAMSGVLFAQDAPPPAGARIITFQEAIRIALDQN